MDSTLHNLNNTDIPLRSILGYTDDEEESVEELLLRAEIQQAEMTNYLRNNGRRPANNLLVVNVESDDDVVFVSEIRNTTVNLCSPDRPQRLPNHSNASTQTMQPESPARSSEQDERPLSPKGTVIICSICLDSAVENAPHSTNCGHIFCGACLQRAIRITKKCPLCKKTLNMKNIFPIFL